MVLLLALLLLAPLAADSVRIDTGIIEGKADDEVRVYLGIPYAAPPVGDLRWRPPQPAAKWGGARPAREYGPICMQSRPPAGSFKQSEDCLTLNVWAPVQAGKVPVMVWIHGGAYANGSGAYPVIDGTRLARNKVVVVTLNYRLNDFGFFAHPELSREQAGGKLGNYGLMDQIAALEWVKRNIGAFGGDPGRVTIFGESAGAGSVLCLMVSPPARGLFHRAIVQSGSGSTAVRTLGSLEATGVQQARAWQADSLAAMRKLSAQEIVSQPAGGGGLGAYSPVIDGKVLAESVPSAFARGVQAPVPMIIGANSWEGSLIAGPRPVFSLDNLPEGVRNQAAELYGADATAATAALFGDLVFAMPARRFAGQMAKVNAPAWLYHFSYVPERLRGKVPGASHAAEIRYVFDNAGAGLAPGAISADERRLSGLMSAYWAAFAASGNPNGNARPEWPAYLPASDRLLDFGGPEPVVRERFRKTQYDFLESAVMKGMLGGR